MKKNKILLLLTVSVSGFIFLLYIFFFQRISITHLSKVDKFEYGNLYTKYYLIDHFEEWDEKTKQVIHQQVQNEIKQIIKGNQLSLVYVINNENLINTLVGNSQNYLKDGVDNLATDDIVAQSYIIKDSAGTIRHQSIEFKNR